jgi:chromosome segregation ATPase
MAIQIVPFLSALSNVAGTAWDLYRRAAQLTESKRGQQAQDSLAKNVDRLEESHLEQARLISELSRDLERFAQALQTEVQEIAQRQARLRALIYFALAVAATGVGISWFHH